MDPYSPTFTCKCTPTRRCSRHLSSSHSAPHDGQQHHVQQYLSDFAASDKYDEANASYSRQQAVPLPSHGHTEQWMMTLPSWNLNQGLNASPSHQRAEPSASTHAGSAFSEFQLRSASDSYIQQLSIAQGYDPATLPAATSLMPSGTVESLNRSQSLDSSPAFHLSHGQLPADYSYMPSQQWRPVTALSDDRMWQQSTEANDDSSMAAEHGRLHSPAQLQMRSMQPLAYQPSTVSSPWPAMPRSEVPTPSEQAFADGRLHASHAIPSRYWMVRIDSRVVERNGIYAIELDSPSREMVPAVRFEDAFQDALQGNLTTPISMREAWQLQNVPTSPRPVVSYHGTSTAGVNKSRKSSVFPPFVATLPETGGLRQHLSMEQPQPSSLPAVSSAVSTQEAVVLIDDVTSSGQPFLRPLRSSPYLPDTVSTREAGWLIEAILRRDWTITLEDVMDRMLGRIRLDISTYNRWRRQDKAVYDFEDEPRSRYGT